MTLLTISEMPFFLNFRYEMPRKYGEFALHDAQCLGLVSDQPPNLVCQMGWRNSVQDR